MKPPRLIITFTNFIKKFVFWSLGKFYLFLVIFLGSLLCFNFMIQDLKNRNIRLEMERKIILIDISNHEAKISSKIISIINKNKGFSIQPDQIKILTQPKKTLSAWQKFLIFLNIKNEKDFYN